MTVFESCRGDFGGVSPRKSSESASGTGSVATVVKAGGECYRNFSTSIRSLTEKVALVDRIVRPSEEAVRP